jgi:hypothetical protein
VIWRVGGELSVEGQFGNRDLTSCGKESSKVVEYIGEIDFLGRVEFEPQRCFTKLQVNSSKSFALTSSTGTSRSGKTGGLGYRGFEEYGASKSPGGWFGGKEFLVGDLEAARLTTNSPAENRACSVRFYPWLLLTFASL